MKKHFKKELVISKENKRNFRKSKNSRICNKLYSEKGIRIYK